ncbi:ROK family protein [Olsenella sp. DNF00959]|uniref:ROK family protein n=1 Tax=Olsenella TaxID=133925 RepID=UPI000785FD26|nr:ROK family protein [Olsenella sp. DNF00959]KXB63821.1 ROK family protein [Olsenella sp. DNF00959]
MAAEAKRVIALDIGGTKIASALVTLRAGEAPLIEHYGKVPTEAKLGGQRVLGNAIESARRVAEAAVGGLDGIGVSSAGVIDPATGDVTYANEIMPGWGGTHLGAELARELGLPARVLNDVHAHALGEARWGGGRDASSCLVVAVGTGIGGAFVLGGHILLGAHNEAGHVGHVSCSDATGVPCSCGATGHLEPIAAGPGIIERYLELGGDATQADGSPMDGAEIDRRAARGDQAARDAEARSGHAIGEVLGSMCNMLDPDCVILSGSVAQCGPAWHDAMERGWHEAVMPPVASTPVRSGELGGNAPLIGAAENVVRSGYAEFE